MTARAEFPIALSVGCPVACPYCPQEKFVSRYRELGGPTMMEPASLRRYLATVPRGMTLVFSGFAEPFANPKAREMMEECLFDGWSLRLDTTLVGCTEADIDFIASTPWAHLKIHLPSQGDTMKRPVDAAYLSQLARVVKAPAEIEHVHFGKLSDAVSEIVGPSVPSRLHSRAGNVPGMAVGNHGGLLRECNWFRRGHLLPNGLLCLCCEDWGLEHILGDLNRQSYAEIFASAEFEELLARHADGTRPLLCRRCDSPWHTGADSQLLIGAYPESRPERAAEYADCLARNIANPLIGRIVVLAEPGAVVPEGDKIEVVPVPDRPGFDRFFAEATKRATADTISIIANSDIYFDDTLALAAGMGAHDCYALLRYETSPFSIPETGGHAEAGQQIRRGGRPTKQDPRARCDAPVDCCQDAWIFRGPVYVRECGFPIGIPGCDGRIACLATQTAYRVTNPSLSIRCWHVHAAARGPWWSWTMPGPYIYLTPVTLPAKPKF